MLLTSYRNCEPIRLQVRILPSTSQFFSVIIESNESLEFEYHVDQFLILIFYTVINILIIENKSI